MLKVQGSIFLFLLLFWATAKSFAQIEASGITSVAITGTAPSTDSFFVVNHLQNLSDSQIVVRNIIIEGNKRTRRPIMLRELRFKEGDTIKIKDLSDIFRNSQSLLKNTQLFHTVNIALIDVEKLFADIKITVEEKWYILPFPYFKPIDRNLNQWLFEKGANFNRVDYGVKLLYSNVTGNNDKLNFYFITGYTKQLILSYRRPFIDKELKWGINFDLSLGKNREINYNTVDDKQVFLKYDTYVKNFFRSSAELTYRKAFYTKHAIGIGFNTQRIKDTVLKLNPLYFNLNKTGIQYPEIYYKLSYQNLDYMPYPTRGYAGELFFSKRGFTKNMNVWELKGKWMGLWHWGKNSFYSISALGTLKLPFKQPYFNTQLLGYNDLFLRGYEYYVVDGVAGGIVNASLTQRLTNFSFHIPYTKWLTPRQIPLKIYGKVFGNMGYVYNKEPGNNSLPNKMLFGGGIGLDIFTMYDFTLNLQFSFNQLGQNGIYLHKKGLF